MSTESARSPRPDAGLPRRNLPLLLLHARESVIGQFRPLLNEHGVTEQQWRILRALAELGPLEPRQMVDVCRISSPSLAGVLSRMDDLGLVKRERHANDQRRVEVTLTPKSQKLAAALAPKIGAIYESIESHIGRDFIDRFYATLDELIVMMEHLPQDSAD